MENKMECPYKVGPVIIAGALMLSLANKTTSFKALLGETVDSVINNKYCTQEQCPIWNRFVNECGHLKPLPRGGEIINYKGGDINGK